MSTPSRKPLSAYLVGALTGALAILTTIHYMGDAEEELHKDEADERLGFHQ